MKSHKRKSKASGSTRRKVAEAYGGYGRYSRKALARKTAKWNHDL